MRNEKELADTYEIIQSVTIGDRKIIVGEKHGNFSVLPYIVAYCECDGISKKYYDLIAGDDFLEIMEIYSRRTIEQIQRTRGEFFEAKMQGIDEHLISASMCRLISYEDHLSGKLLVLKPECLRPEYRKATKQLQWCIKDFGRQSHDPNAKLYCKELYSGKERYFDRTSILGILEQKHWPEWIPRYLQKERMESTQ